MKRKGTIIENTTYPLYSCRIGTDGKVISRGGQPEDSIERIIAYERKLGYRAVRDAKI
jgi:hypothetical protein